MCFFCLILLDFMVLVLLSAHAERFSVSGIFLRHCKKNLEEILLMAFGVSDR